MRRQTSQKAELFARALRMGILGVFAVFVSVFLLSLATSSRTSAATSSTINFQARLETAAGAIVPDGNYNVEFKLYSASSGGTAEWTEDYTYNSGPSSTDARIRVANGYLTVNLGSLCAFATATCQGYSDTAPNWNQQQWLTMNIGGTGTSGSFPSMGNGEMSPRIQLTAVPYAFTSGSISTTDGSGHVGTLSFPTSLTNATDTITLPDASGTVCLQSSSSCGFATGSGSAFLQGGNTFSGSTAGELGTNNNGVLNFRTNNADKLQLDTSGNLIFQQASVINVVSATTGTTLTIQGGAATTGTNVGGSLLLQGGAGASTGASGSVIVRSNTNNSTTAFQVQNASSANILTVDTANTAIIFGNDVTPSALTVRGGAATGTDVTGSNITFNASNGTGAGGSGDFIFQTASAPLPSAVTYYSSSSSVSSGTAASLSWSHTIGSNSNRLLMVNVMTYTASVSSVKYNGTNLTNLSTISCATELDGDTCSDSVWYLKDSSLPAAGTYTVLVTLSGSDYIAAGATSFYNANQTSTFGSTVTATQVTSSLSAYVPTTSAKQMVFDAESSQDYTPSPDSNQTLSWTQLGTSGQQGSAGYRQGTGSTVVMSWTKTSTSSGSPDNDQSDTDTRAIIAVPINPLTVSSSTADTLNDVLHLKGNGNVGINTSNPQATLSVNGNAYFTNGNLSILGVGAAPTSLTAYAGSNQGGSLLGDGTTYYYQVSAITATGETIPSNEVWINGNANSTNHFTQLTPAGNPTLALAAGTNLGIGLYRYTVTFVTANGDTGGKNQTTITTTTGNQAVNLTNIPIGPAGTTSRRIWRTTVGGGSQSERLLTTIANNTATTYSDTTPDASLGSSISFGSNTAMTNTNNAVLTWAAVSGATSYRIYRGTSRGGENVYFTSATNSYTDTGTAGTSGTEVSSDTTQRLGIGTTSPRASLDVIGSAIFETPVNSTTGLQVQDSSGTGVLSVDTINKTLNLSGPSSIASYSWNNDLETGNFSTVGNWTNGTGGAITGWNITGGGDDITHVAGGSGTSNWLKNAGVTLIAGHTYQVSFDISGTCGTSSDELTVLPNGTANYNIDGTDCSSLHTITTTVPSYANSNLYFVPSANWTSTISFVDILEVSNQMQPTIAVQNASSGSNMFEFRNSYGSMFLGTQAGYNYAGGSGEGNDIGIGSYSLQSNTDGEDNVAIGQETLQYNTEGGENVAIGSWALNYNTDGWDNTAIGVVALEHNTVGQYNVAVGSGASESNSAGNNNTVVGTDAFRNGIGYSNSVGIGYRAGYNVNSSGNTFIGYQAGYQDSGGNFATVTTVQNATAIGTYAQVQASNSIVLGGVDTATKVGIGITVPGNIFSVSPLDYQTGTATRTNGSATLVGTGTTWTSTMSGDIIVFADGTTNYVSGFTDTTHIIMSSTYTGTTDASPVYYRFHHQALDVTSAGLVGIGQANPDAALSVRQANQNAVVNIYGADSTGGCATNCGIIQVSSQGSLTNSSNRALSLQPNNGDVLIATTTDLGAKLSVGGTTLIKTTSATALQIQDGSSNSLLVGDTSGLKLGVGATDSTSRLNVSLDIIDAANGSALRIGGNLTSTTNSTEGLRVMPVTNLASNSTQSYTGAVAGVSSTDGTHLVSGKLVGLQAAPFFNASSGTLGSLFGQIIQPINNNTATVTTAEGLYIQTINTTTGTIGTNYGIYIDAPSNVGTISSNYALVTAAGAGNVGIGTLTPTFKLDVSGTTRVNVASATAFQVQNGSGANLLTADTSSTAIVLGNDGTTSAFTVRGGAASGTNAAGSNITVDASNGTGLGGSGALIFRTALGSGTPVQDSVSSAQHQTGTTLMSWSHTIGNQGNRLLLVAISTAGATGAATVKFNSTSLSPVPSGSATDATSSYHTELWYLAGSAVTVGTGTVTITFASGTDVVAGSASYYNVNQATPLGTAVPVGSSGASGSSPATVTVGSTATTNIVFSSFAFKAATGFWTPSQTQLWYDATSNGGAASSTAGLAGSTTMTWTHSASGEKWALVGVAINPSGGTPSGSDALTDRLHISSNGNIGISNASPQYTLDVAGTTNVKVDSTNAFQVQSAGGTPLLTADTLNSRLGIGNVVPAATLDVLTGAATVGLNLAGTALSSAGGANGANASNILTVVGTAGQADSGTGFTAGSGSAISLTSGVGGANTGASGTPTGGAAGNITIQGGVGGAASSTTNGTGGGGGAITIQGGNGGAGGATGTGGSGGSITLKAGDGGGTGGIAAPGNILIQAGNSVANSASGSVIVSSVGNNNATAFEIQNTLSSNAFLVDTTSLNNLITNGNFEGSSVSSWTAKGTAAAPSRDTTTLPYIGLASLTDVAGTASGNGIKYTTSLSAVTYALSFSVRQLSGTALTSSNFEIGWNNNTTDTACTGLTPSLASQPPSTSYWVRYTCTFTGSVAGHIYWKLSAAVGSSVTFNIDAVQLEQASTSTAYAETSLSLNGLVESPLVIQNKVDSNAALQVFNATGKALLSVSTANLQVKIGAGSAGEATPALLVIDNQTGSASDPTEVDGAMYYNVTTNSYRCGANGGWYECSINNIQYNYNFEDDFLGGTATGTFGSLSNVGQLGWAVTQGTTCTVAYNGVGPQGHDHPGVVGLTAGAVSGDFCVMAQGGTNAGATSRSEVVAAGDVVRSTVDISAVNQGVFRFGMTNNAANSVAPTSGAWFEYVNATDATHWRYCYANNAAATCAATTQTVSATTWYQLEIRFVSTSAITFNLRQLPSGTLETHALTAITYDTGATNKLSPVYVCDATTTTNLICGVDYFQWQGIITTSGGR